MVEIQKLSEEPRKISTLDAHAAGEPLRIITEGIESIPGKSILEKRRFARQNLDNVRRSLMFEPRGHADMYGAIITEPVTDDGDLGVLFMHNEGWSTMCGHGVIALVTAALETGMLPRQKSTINLDTPAGRVKARAMMNGNRVEKVTFENVPSFVFSHDDSIDVKGFGKIQYDIAFGGAFYAFVDAADLGIKIVPKNVRTLIDAGTAIKRAVASCGEIRHPAEKDLSFLYGTIIYGPPASGNANSRNVCIFAEGEVDRSPTGTGVSARLAIEYSKGRLRENEDFVVESILGTTFAGQVVGKTKLANYDAVIPSVTGRAWITGRSQFLIYSDDPLKDGFLLR
jgi:proline racemase